MKIYKVGDKGQAICHHCEKIMPTTFQIRDLPVSDSNQVVKEVLAIVCDECGNICGFPNQSLKAVVSTVKRVNAQELEVLLADSPKEAFKPTDEDREWLDEAPKGKEI